MNLKNKVALVTGSSRGIGKETVIELARNGCNVVINYNHSKIEAESLKKYVEKKFNISALVIKADVTNEEEVNDMVKELIHRFGKIDILVNNAGIDIDSLYDDKTVENFKKVLDVNLIGTFIVCKAVEKYMTLNKYGKIVNVASNNAIDSYYPESLDYDASKSGVISLTHNLAVQYAPFINVNVVAPGWVNTDMNKNLDKRFIDKENNKTLLGRFAESDEIAKVIVFLCSDDAS